MNTLFIIGIILNFYNNEQFHYMVLNELLDDRNYYIRVLEY